MKVRSIAFICLIACSLLISAPAAAAPKKPDPKKKDAAKNEPSPEDEPAAVAEFESQLKYRPGRGVLPGGVATLNVPDGFRYLPPEQADKILVEAWGNPPGTKTLGMLFPSDVSPLLGDGWGVVITYQEDGHVDDGDAGGINYDEMLGQMKKDTGEDNEARQKEGYEPITLVGWATPPHYDAATHKLYWARELSFASMPEHTLNYDIRVLGRTGVLSFNAVASMGKLRDIENSMKEVMGFADFNSGQRYGDYSSGSDHLAAYGIGALVAGKIAAKVGFFKLILVGLLAAKKFIVLAVVTVGGFVARLFRRNKS